MRITPTKSRLYRTECAQPLRYIHNAEPAPGPAVLPEQLRDAVVIDAIHDGDVIPNEFLCDTDGRTIPETAFLQSYVVERDWGAALVAQALSQHLGLPGTWRVEIARVVMDFGRFPGITPRDSTHLSRRAINYPFSALLGFEQKRRILDHYYDTISAHLDTVVADAQVKIAIHTYDRYNQSGTLRPPVSVLTRCEGYQYHSEMPIDAFDPLYPDVLGEFTADRRLRDRVSLTLERAGISTEHNYPYLLPDGSVEVRSQVWNFFRRLREAFVEAHPATDKDDVYTLVWDMLLDTNHRCPQSELLRGYLHAYRRVSPENEARFAQARRAYMAIGQFVNQNHGEFVEYYRHQVTRPSALGIEIRKDLVYRFDERGYPIEPKTETIDFIAGVLARAVHTYFTVDRQEPRVFLTRD